MDADRYGKKSRGKGITMCDCGQKDVSDQNVTCPTCEQNKRDAAAVKAEKPKKKTKKKAASENKESETE